MKRIIASLCILAIAFLPCTLSGQEQKGLETIVNDILTARKASNELIPKYSWTSRTEVLKSSEILNMLIEKNKYEPDGQLQQTVLNQEGAKMPTAFLIRKIAEEEKTSLENFLFGLRDFLRKYSLEANGQVDKFISAATWQKVDSTKEYMFTGRNVEEEGDELTWWVDQFRYSTSKIVVSTTFQGDVVHFTATFMTLRDGLNYMAYAEALVPARNITLQIQNYDYTLE